MSAKTKIVVLHMKELIYTVVFAALAVILIVLLVIMFRPEKENVQQSKASYTAGVYTATADINNTTFEIEVLVDEERIKAIHFVNLADSVTTMYPLAATAMEQLEEQIIKEQSLENISYTQDSQYTSMVFLQAISEALEQAKAKE